MRLDVKIYGRTDRHLVSFTLCLRADVAYSVRDAQVSRHHTEVELSARHDSPSVLELHVRIEGISGTEDFRMGGRFINTKVPGKHSHTVLR